MGLHHPDFAAAGCKIEHRDRAAHGRSPDRGACSCTGPRSRSWLAIGGPGSAGLLGSRTEPDVRKAINL